MSQPPTAVGNLRDSYRRRSRQNVRIACYACAAAEDPNLAVALLDASQTGARLVVRAALAKGQTLAVLLEGLGCAAIQRRGTVMWCVPAGDGTHAVGIRFQERLPYAALIRLTEL
jgi:hypothetical protein